MSMINSARVGLDNGMGYEWVKALNVPLSLMIYYYYSYYSKYFGPRLTLRMSYVLIGGSLVSMYILLVILPDFVDTLLSKVLNILFYVFRETYCSLHGSYMWVFIQDFYFYANHRKDPNGSERGVADREKSGMVVLVGGLCALASVTGSVILYFHEGNIHFLLVMSIACIGASWGFMEFAFYVMREPVAIAERKRIMELKRSSCREEEPSLFDKNKKLCADCWRLATTNGLLRMLFLEAVMHQFSSNIVNQVFNDALRTGIDQDNDRAYVSGNMFMVVNIAASCLQIIVMPSILTTVTMPYLLLSPPVVTLLTSSGTGVLLTMWRSQQRHHTGDSPRSQDDAACSMLTRWRGGCQELASMGTHSRSGLATMSREQLLSLVVPVTPLVVLKVFEYAVKTSAIEMIFMPMSNEIRYLGRELVRFFGQKVGKWLSQQALSVTVTFVSFYTRSEVDSIALLFICAVACAMWICVTMHLSRHLIKPKLS